jgi:hypothetical protein
MDPAEISRELLLEADHSFRAGEPRHSRSGIAPTAVHAETYWLGTLSPASWPTDLSFPVRPGSAKFNDALDAANVLEVALSLCTALFLRTHAAFFRRIRSDGGQVRLLVSLSPKAVRGFMIAPDTGRALHELGITIEFEFTSS